MKVTCFDLNLVWKMLIRRKGLHLFKLVGGAKPPESTGRPMSLVSCCITGQARRAWSLCLLFLLLKTVFNQPDID